MGATSKAFRRALRERPLRRSDACASAFASILRAHHDVSCHAAARTIPARTAASRVFRRPFHARSPPRRTLGAVSRAACRCVDARQPLWLLRPCCRRRRLLARPHPRLPRCARPSPAHRGPSGTSGSAALRSCTASSGAPRSSAATHSMCAAFAPVPACLLTRQIARTAVAPPSPTSRTSRSSAPKTMQRAGSSASSPSTVASRRFVAPCVQCALAEESPRA